MNYIRRSIQTIMALTLTPTIAFLGFLVGYLLVCAWCASGQEGDKWAENYWRSWGRALRCIGGLDEVESK